MSRKTYEAGYHDGAMNETKGKNEVIKRRDKRIAELENKMVNHINRNNELGRRMEYMYANMRAEQGDMSGAVIASWFDDCGKALEGEK